jgi:hypothetical protein
MVYMPADIEIDLVESLGNTDPEEEHWYTPVIKACHGSRASKFRLLELIIDEGKRLDMEEMNQFLRYAYSLGSRLRDRQEDGLFAKNEECEERDRRERKIE